MTMALSAILTHQGIRNVRWVMMLFCFIFSSVPRYTGISVFEESQNQLSRTKVKSEYEFINRLISNKS